jgi:hypothetical protein
MPGASPDVVQKPGLASYSSNVPLALPSLVCLAVPHSILVSLVLTWSDQSLPLR